MDPLLNGAISGLMVGAALTFFVFWGFVLPTKETKSKRRFAALADSHADMRGRLYNIEHELAKANSMLDQRAKEYVEVLRERDLALKALKSVNTLAREIHDACLMGANQ